MSPKASPKAPGKSPLFGQMAVCGVGLIGGSLAMIARRHNLVGRIVGFGRTQANLDVALERKLIDFATRDAAEAARDSDLVVLAVPITTMPALLREMAPHLPPAAVVTDVGSVKGWVVSQLEPLLGPKMALVAAHPVAGKETTGAAAADRDLFKDRRVIITPSSRSTPEALDKIETLWRATGARVERMDADLHDLLLARASHLPQLVSTTLAAALVEERVKDRFAATYGAGGLRDTTRLAASSPEMWRDICLTNRDAILDALKLFSGAYAELERLIENSDSDGVEALFKRAARIRTMLENKKGPVVAIDGPVGAGKSSVARELARALNFSHINTGAMYRAVALAARDAGISFDSPGRDQALSKLLRAIEIRFEGERIFLDGRDVTGMLAETEIGDLASRFSTLPSVRDRMRELQRLAGAQGNVVMEGRDIGTAVFPDADFKFYLDADVKLRAERRFAELSAKGTDILREEVLAQIIERDRRDSTRELAPLRCADDAIVVDSTELAIAQVVEQIKNKIKGNVRGRHRA